MKILQYVLVSGFFFCVPVFAFASSLGIAVDQTSVAFDIDSGEEQKFIVEIMNISDRNQEIVVGVQDYMLDDNNQLALIEENDEQNGVKDWVGVENNNITLAPEESKNVVFTVKTPDDAVMGSHRGAVLFRATSDTNESVKVQGQIGVHVLINVKGDTHASGRVNSFDIPLLTFGSVDYDAEFENTGNIHYVPYGEVVVRNVFTHHEQMYKYDKHFVFPGKKFMFGVSDEVPSLFGLYRARATFVDGEGVTRAKMDYTMGYFFPLILILSIGAIIFIVHKLRKRGKRKSVVKKQKISQNKLSKKKQITKSKKETQSDNGTFVKGATVKEDNKKEHKINVKT